jgi:hypothetical protein
MFASHRLGKIPTRRRRVGRQHRQRRGILILVVLSLLFMFVMIAVTFVLIANRQNSTASKAAAADLIGDTPYQEVQAALNVLVRGDNSALSPFANTNLLVDMYGDPPAGGAGAGPNQYSKKVTGAYAANAGGNGYATVTLASSNNEYDGRVITIIAGSTTGTQSSLVSSRIFASDGTRVFLLPFRDPAGKPVVDGNYDFLINGREFAGTGKTTSLILNPVSSMASSTGSDPSAQGGENESYDAPDFNNPHLAYIELDPTTYEVRRVKPSFHDPSLIQQQGGETASNSFRALRSISGYPGPSSYQWDVDNDGDGMPDSIWIDPGFPIQMSRDGRLYKRLLAPLLLDLDGRLNVNTAGTSKQIANPPKANTDAMPFATGGRSGGPTAVGPRPWRGPRGNQHRQAAADEHRDQFAREQRPLHGRQRCRTRHHGSVPKQAVRHPSRLPQFSVSGDAFHRRPA